VQPARRADLRAEVAAVVVQVLKDNGEAVKAGDLLMRLDDTSLRDGLASSEESLRASTQAFVQAERTVQRLKTLQAQGMTSTQALEDAEVRRNSTQSDWTASRARVVAAAPAARAHAGASAVWRCRQRAQGVHRRHRADRQGAGQGDRPAQHALRGLRLGRPPGRAEARPGGEFPHQRLRRRPPSRAASSASTPPSIPPRARWR
jgi:multidrug resistance efflux pump